MLHSQNIYKKQITPLADPEYKGSYLFADPETADRQRHRGQAREVIAEPSASQTSIQQAVEPTPA
jgi:hypothetical protein